MAKQAGRASRTNRHSPEGSVNKTGRTYSHKNARLTPTGRAPLVRRVRVEGHPIPEVSRGMGVSVRTVYQVARAP